MFATEYFQASGEILEGDFINGKILQSGVLVDPSHDGDERNDVIRKVQEKRLNISSKKNQNIVFFEDIISVISDREILSDFFVSNMNRKRIFFLITDLNYKNNISELFWFIDSQKIDYELLDLLQFSSLRKDALESAKTKVLLILRNAMESGKLLLINLDDKYNMVTEFPVFIELQQFIDSDFLNYNLDKINKTLFQNGLDGLQAIHENFNMIIWTKSIINLEEHRKGKTYLDKEKKEDIFIWILKKYKWMERVGGLRIGIIESLKRSGAFYETEILDESHNFVK